MMTPLPAQVPRGCPLRQARGWGNMADDTTQVGDAPPSAAVSAAKNGAVIIRVEDVSKWFGKFLALKRLNLEVSRGERIVICGPSGSGKSTFIRCLNRLEKHQRGHITIDGVELTD